MMTLSRAQLQAHAKAWILAWNQHDIDQVLSAFADEALFVSNLAQVYTGATHVRGKEALRQYWQAAIADRQDLHFELLDAICDASTQTVVVHYIASVGAKRTRACEIMRFEDGQQIYGEALHGIPANEVSS